MKRHSKADVTKPNFADMPVEVLLANSWKIKSITQFKTLPNQDCKAGKAIFDGSLILSKPQAKQFLHLASKIEVWAQQCESRLREWDSLLTLERVTSFSPIEWCWTLRSNPRDQHGHFASA